MSDVRKGRLAVGSVMFLAALLPLQVHAQTDSERDGGCRRRCQKVANEALRECRAAGDDASRCRHRAKVALKRCLREECQAPGDCELRCKRASDDRRDACIAEGGTPEACEKEAADFLISCVLRDCRHRPVCRKRCRRTARRFLRRCLADGGKPKACAVQSRERFRACVAECGQVCGGFAGLACEEGEFCKMPPGSCRRIDGFGVCRAIPEGCPDVWEPVCGCDHETYGNECEADVAGVSVARRGECPILCDPTVKDECPDGTFCRSRIGQCDDVNVDVDVPGEPAGPAGSCVPIPESCPDRLHPVCGCDGENYSNPCEADIAGVSVASFGDCRVSCAANGDCTDTQFCRLPDGECGLVDPAGLEAAVGFCVPRPRGCRDGRDSVCGCDGVTYASRCEANQAGVTVDHRGDCK